MGVIEYEIQIGGVGYRRVPNTDTDTHTPVILVPISPSFRHPVVAVRRVHETVGLPPGLPAAAHRVEARVMVVVAVVAVAAAGGNQGSGSTTYCQQGAC